MVLYVFGVPPTETVVTIYDCFGGWLPVFSRQVSFVLGISAMILNHWHTSCCVPSFSLTKWSFHVVVAATIFTGSPAAYHNCIGAYHWLFLSNKCAFSSLLQSCYFRSVFYHLPHWLVRFRSAIFSCVNGSLPKLHWHSMDCFTVLFLWSGFFSNHLCAQDILTRPFLFFSCLFCSFKISTELTQMSPLTILLVLYVSLWFGCAAYQNRCDNL